MSDFFRWVAPLYNRAVDPYRSAADAAAIARRLRPFLHPGSALLDLGGGTGAGAALLAGALHARVTVLDASQHMLAYVPSHPAVLPTLGFAEAMPFADSSFEAAFVSDAFHHFRDQDAAARELARVVRPGGCVLILEMDPRGWTRLVVAAERFFGEAGSFSHPTQLREFLWARGIVGECRVEHGTSYSFLGIVHSPNHG